MIWDEVTSSKHFKLPFWLAKLIWLGANPAPPPNWHLNCPPHRNMCQKHGNQTWRKCHWDVFWPNSTTFQHGSNFKIYDLGMFCSRQNKEPSKAILSRVHHHPFYLISIVWANGINWRFCVDFNFQHVKLYKFMTVLHKNEHLVCLNQLRQEPCSFYCTDYVWEKFHACQIMTYTEECEQVTIWRRQSEDENYSHSPN